MEKCLTQRDVFKRDLFKIMCEITEEAETVLNVGVSGPGVIARALERLIEERGRENLKLDQIAEEIKQTTFRVTRCGELIG